MPHQVKGDSVRRQTDDAADWCRRNKVPLDTVTRLHDLGRSAYTGAHRKNPDRHALACFLKMVEDGKVPRGSFLIIENLDRLSREHIQPALLLVLNLLQAGVRIVQLKPAEIIFDDKSDTLPVMMMMMELARGHGESAMKSERCGQAWVNKRAEARQKHSPLTTWGPAWLEMVGRRLEGKHVRGGKYRVIPERAAAVQRIFQLAAAGYGQKLIMGQLLRENVQPFGRPLTEADVASWPQRRKDRHGDKKDSPTQAELDALRRRVGELGFWKDGEWVAAHWNSSTVGAILRDRRVLGEFQPRRDRGREDIDEPIPGYYPRVIDEDLWLAARAQVTQRRVSPGRVGRHVNVFAGLLHDARGTGTYCCSTQQPTKARILINTAAMEGRARCFTFPFRTFEAAVLGALAEIDPHEILNGDTPPDESLVLAGQLAAVEGKITELEAELLRGDVQALARVLRKLEEEKRDLAQRLAQARQKAARPLSAAWGEAQTLVGALGAAPDPLEARLRLRSVLRRIVDGIWLLVVARGHDRLCAVQIWFAERNKHRDYLVLHRPPKANKQKRVEGGWWCQSLATVAKPGDLDLRKPDHVRRLEKSLATMSLSLPR
jgi:DNA invertase Pin-like site-specific DNA recombinase